MNTGIKTGDSRPVSRVRAAIDIVEASVFKSITEGGRTRADYKLDLKYDLPLDFYIGLGFTLNYDNQPVEGASESDYVFQTSFGWEL